MLVVHCARFTFTQTVCMRTMLCCRTKWIDQRLRVIQCRRLFINASFCFSPFPSSLFSALLYSTCYTIQRKKKFSRLIHHQYIRKLAAAAASAAARDSAYMLAYMYEIIAKKNLVILTLYACYYCCRYRCRRRSVSAWCVCVRRASLYIHTHTKKNPVYTHMCHCKCEWRSIDVSEYGSTARVNYSVRLLLTTANKRIWKSVGIRAKRLKYPLCM